MDAADVTQRNPALEDAIDADPCDPLAYAVYGDWLHGEGDPRGELIALQIAGQAEAAATLIERHASVLLGALAVHQKTHDGQDREAFLWKYGFIHAARLSDRHHGATFAWASVDPSARKVEGNLAAVLEELLCHPSGRFLTELTVVFNEDLNNDLQDLIDVLATKAPRSLRKLHLGDFVYPDQTEMSWYHVGDLATLWAAVPRLSTLIVQGGSFTLGPIALPDLTSATFRTGGLSKANARAIASASWPKIEALEIWYGDENYGAEATVEDVQLLLARTDLPALTKLGLKNTQFTDELCGTLAGAELVKQLTELDLSMGCMTDEGAQVLAAGTSALVHLAVLDVSQNYLTGAGLAALEGVAKQVVGANQRDDEGQPAYRHPAVGE